MISGRLKRSNKKKNKKICRRKNARFRSTMSRKIVIYFSPIFSKEIMIND